MTRRRKVVKREPAKQTVTDKLSALQEEFIKLFRESVVTQAILTLMFGATIVYFYIVGRDVPVELWNIFYSLGGIWLGGKLTLRPSK